MLLNLLRRFLKRENGNVAMIVAVAMMPMAISAGVAIDFVRAHLAKTSLQQAIDAAGLASGSDTDTTADQVKSMAQSFLDANTQGLRLKPGQTKIEAKEVGGIKQVSIKATAEMNTTFLKLANINTLDVTIDSMIQRKEAGPLHVALVLDVTDSMTAIPTSGGSETKLKSLQDAAKSLVNDLMTGSNPHVAVSVVPYSGGVRLFSSTDAAGVRAKPPAWLITQTNDSKCTSWAQTQPNVKACRDNWADGSEKYGCWRDGLWRTDVNCCPWQCTNAVDRTYHFTGCVGPRLRDAKDNLLENHEAYLRTINNPTNPPYPGVAENMWNCPGNGSTVVPLTNDKTTVIKRIDDLATGGDTFIPGGVTWGWNMLAAKEKLISDPPESVGSLKARGGRKVMVLMTDGINALTWRTTNTDTDGEKGSNLGWLVGTSNPNAPGGPNKLTLDLCENIKAAGIEIFTVLFDVKDPVTEKMLQDCAADDDKERDYFNASAGADLRNAFGAIGNQLRTVKLTQ